MGNAKRIARRIVGLAEMSTPPDGIPYKIHPEWAANSPNVPGAVNIRPPLVDPQTDCEECGASLPPGVDPIDAGWSVGQKDGEFLCEECKMNPDDDPGYF